MSPALSLSTRLVLGKSLAEHGIPALGLGVWQTPSGKPAYNAVLHALKSGYRHIDTAAMYQNEKDVGRAIHDSGVPREDVFITTKLWNSDQGTSTTTKAFNNSLTNLGVSYIDLYLIHSPLPGKQKRQESWREMIALQQQGLIRHIGVSNFGIHHLQEFLEEFPDHPPVINQIEVHPFLTRDALCSFCSDHGILVEAYSPLARAKKPDDPVLTSIAKAHGVSWAQVMIRWSLQKGYVVIPKSVKPARIDENKQVFQFELTKEEIQQLDDLNENLITAWDPTTCA